MHHFTVYGNTLLLIQTSGLALYSAFFSLDAEEECGVHNAPASSKLWNKSGCISLPMPRKIVAKSFHCKMRITIYWPDVQRYLENPVIISPPGPRQLALLGDSVGCWSSVVKSQSLPAKNRM
jgi:hypothetical protein